MDRSRHHDGTPNSRGVRAGLRRMSAGAHDRRDSAELPARVRGGRGDPEDAEWGRRATSRNLRRGSPANGQLLEVDASAPAVARVRRRGLICNATSEGSTRTGFLDAEATRALPALGAGL